MYEALVQSDRSYDGIFFVGVRTTGIFCRPTCRAKKPRPQNVEYFTTAAEALHAEAEAADVQVSLATVYNALNQFTRGGLLREVAIEGQKTYFDTNTSSHHHFYIESEERLLDIPDGNLRVVGVPETPRGKEIDRIDVIVRLRDVSLECIGASPLSRLNHP